MTLEEQARALVASFPPPSEDQIARVVAVLRGAERNAEERGATRPAPLEEAS